MSEQETSRRELLKNIGISLSLAGTRSGVLPLEAAQHVHQAAASEKAAHHGVYKPKCFTAPEYKTLERLADRIIPADGKSKGALDAGAAEFIDLLASQNGELAQIFTGGLAWLDRRMKQEHGAAFVDARPEQQTAMLDRIAYTANDSPELGPGIRFFEWARNLVVDAYYTSKVGMDDLGFMGNGAMAKFSVPAEAIAYAVKRSGLK